ncbi:hypothetical protein ACJ41O_013740 [Fusarium nematophilum]
MLKVINVESHRGSPYPITSQPTNKFLRESVMRGILLCHVSVNHIGDDYGIHNHDELDPLVQVGQCCYGRVAAGSSAAKESLVEPEQLSLRR